MAYIALYRKWRPQTFDQVVEQDAVVSILKNAILQERIAHAYLFCGTRGTGKTTLAKIFARAINCEHPEDGNPCNECAICKGLLDGSILDVSEIDAASNNGVDNIRSIIEESVYATTHAKYRVYIIDEVHMLSVGAFNALLKTLEEPPKNVVFILATTEPHKLPVTILSRCQRYDFKRISREGIVSRLEEICNYSNVSYEPAALNFIAQKADGAMRDAISILDQTIGSSNGNITMAAARSSSGSLDRNTVLEFCNSLLAADGVALLRHIDKIFSDGRDPSNFIGELMNMLRDMMVILTVKEPGNMLAESPEEIEELKEVANGTSTSELAYLIKELSLLDNSLKWSVQRKIVFEAGILKLCDRHSSDNEMALRDKISILEQRVADLVASGIKLSYKGGNNIPVEAPKPQPVAVKAPVTVEQDILPIEDEKALPTVENAESVGDTPDPRDWEDFLSALSERGKAAAAAVIRTNAYAKVITSVEGKPLNALCILFKNSAMMNMIDKRDCDLFAQCASRAFGKDMGIIISLAEKESSIKAEDAVSVVEESKPIENDKSLEDALSILQQLSKEEGFNISEE
ncbi:MAG: DNA polymerase III subunit gamma/tau [Ruminococcaceae bacterium]|nr:DNA polymerase III subunit gamma/tau [Oscillospiraceae bacterium]